MYHRQLNNKNQPDQIFFKTKNCLHLHLHTLNIRIDPRGSINFFQKNCDGEFTYLRKSNKFVESNNAIERFWSEKHFKPIFDIWEGV